MKGFVTSSPKFCPVSWLVLPQIGIFWVDWPFFLSVFKMYLGWLLTKSQKKKKLDEVIWFELEFLTRILIFFICRRKYQVFWGAWNKNSNEKKREKRRSSQNVYRSIFSCQYRYSRGQCLQCTDLEKARPVWKEYKLIYSFNSIYLSFIAKPLLVSFFYRQWIINWHNIYSSTRTNYILFVEIVSKGVDKWLFLLYYFPGY